MNKLILSTLLVVSPLIAFAQNQRTRPTRESEGQFDNQSGFPGGPEENALNPGGPGVPIDNYQFLLLGIAVLLIAYFVYRSRQAQQA